MKDKILANNEQKLTAQQVSVSTIDLPNLRKRQKLE